MDRRVDKLHGQWRKSTRLPTSRSAQRSVSCRSLSQCSDVSCGQNCGHCGRPSPCLSQEQHSFLFVQECSGAQNVGRNGCTAARRLHADVWRRIWDCFRDIGDEAHIDAVTKCKAHRSKAEPAKLDETGRFMAAKKERVMTPSNPSCATRTRELSKRVVQSPATLAVLSSERKEEIDGQTWLHRLRDGTRKMNDGNVQHVFWRVLMS